MTDSTVSIPTPRAMRSWVQAWTGSCPILRLPDEILAEIFVQRVYGPCKGSPQDFMIHRIVAIYGRVYTLISVCATWRKIGLGCPNLWLVVPIIELYYPRSPPFPPINTILQRAGSRNLHLVVSMDRLPLEELKNLADHWHRFGVINFWSNSIIGSRTSAVLGTILENSSPGSISRLSLRKSSASSCFYTDTADPRIAEFVGSLSGFRISSVSIKWTEIMFSRRLVKLQIDQITANSDSEIRAFFAALSSACELKDLKLIAIYFDPDLLDKDIPLEVVSLPKLEFLYVERGCRDILDVILSHIARGPYHLTLNLLPNTAGTSRIFFWPIRNEPFYAFLRSVPVDKLILNGYKQSPWEFGTGLQRILESTPNLKTLVLNEFTLGPEVLMGIQRPTLSTLSINGGSFAHLTRLEFRNSNLETSLVDLKPALEAIFRSHRIQKMVLGGVSRTVEGADRYAISYDDEVVKWMRDIVPQFSLADHPYRVPEDCNAWQLWDI